MFNTDVALQLMVAAELSFAKLTRKLELLRMATHHVREKVRSRRICFPTKLANPFAWCFFTKVNSLDVVL